MRATLAFNGLMEALNTIESNWEEDKLEILKKIQINNIRRFLIGHANINSIPKKFEILSSMVKYSIDILVVSKTKLDYFFPQIRIERYAPPFRYDKNSHGSGILLFLREHVPAKHLKNILKGFLWN